MCLHLSIIIIDQSVSFTLVDMEDIEKSGVQ